MSPEKQDVAAEAKKKATIAVVILVLVIIAWQLKGMFTSDAPASTSASLAAAKSQAKPMTNGGAPMPTNPGTNPAAPNPADLVPKQVPVQVNVELMKLQKETEAKYIAALNELQMLKVQREILEVSSAIAKTKLELIGTEKNISDMLTVKPAPVAAPLPDKVYANMLAEGTDSTSLKGDLPGVAADSTDSSGKAAGGSSASSSAIVAPGTAVYTVLSVSQLNRKWNAVLGSNGKLFNVTIGDVISLDGAIVVGINRDGVELEQKGVKKKVLISSNL